MASAEKSEQKSDERPNDNDDRTEVTHQDSQGKSEGNEGELPTLEDIRDEFGETMFKNDSRDLWIPAVGATLYGFPALLALGGVHEKVPPILFMGVSVVLIGLGITIYGKYAGKSGGQDELAAAYDLGDDQKDWPRTFPPDVNVEDANECGQEDLQILLTEYETISEEARYRDRLINRSTYFALAVLAGYGSIFATVDSHVQPLVVMLVSLSMYVFAMALVKYKDARDPLWKRQRDLERLVPAFRENLTTFHTIRTPPRRLLDRYSMSSYLTNLYLTLTMLSVVGYVMLLTVLAWGDKVTI